ncbi:hypothetical protein V6N11_053696 [Hibiscus sabdariffa]|uniref:Uncharacterized protein n=1 Tax=Hibiscus sabdariffa TaxID=183260 RepID=A0ABR2S1U8_9ROSI
MVELQHDLALARARLALYAATCSAGIGNTESDRFNMTALGEFPVACGGIMDGFSQTSYEVNQDAHILPLTLPFELSHVSHKFISASRLGATILELKQPDYCYGGRDKDWNKFLRKRLILDDQRVQSLQALIQNNMAPAKTQDVSVDQIPLTSNVKLGTLNYIVTVEMGARAAHKRQTKSINSTPFTSSRARSPIESRIGAPPTSKVVQPAQRPVPDGNPHRSLQFL